MILRSLLPSPDDLASATGWRVEPRGVCQGDVCVPLRPRTDGLVDVAALAAALGAAIVEEPEAGVWALGPGSGGRALLSANAPELALPDLAGTAFHLSSLLGAKVLLVAWASW